MPVLGKQSVFKLANASGMLTDLSSYIDSVSGLPGSIDLQDTTTYGAAGKTAIAGLPGTDFTVEGPYDAAVQTHFSGIFGAAAAQTYEFGPEGTASGKPRITGSCRLSTFELTSPVAGVVRWRATLRTDGAITFNTY